MSRLLTLLPFAALIASCYGLRQGYYFNDLYRRRVPASELIEAGGTRAEKLRELDRILVFADHSGLAVYDAYREVIEPLEGAISFLVFAAEKTRLEPKTWWFLVTGTVPYLGFMNRKDRDAYSAQLRSEGFDVYESEANAFSSLGFFPDPILSSMLQMRDEDLAHLIFHELTHKTFWSRGSAQFNENLAEFVAETLTVQYLEAAGRTDDIARYRAYRDDLDLYKSWLKAYKADLEGLYGRSEGQPAAQVLKARDQLTRRHQEDEMPKFSLPGFRASVERPWNNARVLASSLYSPDTARFIKAFACLPEGATIGEFITRLKRAEKVHRDAFSALDSLCG